VGARGVEPDVIGTRVLNDELADGFRRWYPAFVAPTSSAETGLAA
jgi:hypothetical protein